MQRRRLNFEDSPETSILGQITFLQTTMQSIASNISLLKQDPTPKTSFFDTLAKAWNKLTWWQKLIPGLAITAPLLLTGFLFNIGTLITLGGLFGLTHLTCGFLFEDHLQSEINIQEALHQAQTNLSELLASTNAELTKLANSLSGYLTALQEQNQTQAASVATQQERCQQLAGEIETLRTTQQLLQGRITTLKGELSTQNELSEQQSHQLDQAQQQLSDANTKYAASQLVLQSNDGELERVQVSMSLSIEKAALLASVLTSTITTLSQSSLGDQSQKVAFQTQLETTLKENEPIFIALSDRISEAKTELRLVQEQLTESQKHYNALLTTFNELLDEQEKLVQRQRNLTQLNTPQKSQAVAGALGQHGVFAITTGDAHADMAAASVTEMEAFK